MGSMEAGTSAPTNGIAVEAQQRSNENVSQSHNENNSELVRFQTSKETMELVQECYDAEKPLPYEVVVDEEVPGYYTNYRKGNTVFIRYDAGVYGGGATDQTPGTLDPTPEPP